VQFFHFILFRSCKLLAY